MALAGFFASRAQNAAQNVQTGNARNAFGFEGSPFAGSRNRGFTAGMFPHQAVKQQNQFFSGQVKASKAMSSALDLTAKNTEMSVDALEKQINLQDSIKAFSQKDFGITEKSFKAEVSMNKFFKRAELNRTRREFRFHREMRKQAQEHQKINLVNWKKLLHHMGIITHKKSWPIKLASAVVSGLTGLLGGLFSTAVGLGSMQMLRSTIKRAGLRAGGAGFGRAAGQHGAEGLLKRIFGRTAGRAGARATGEVGEQLAFGFMRDQAGRQPGILSRIARGIGRKLPVSVVDPDLVQRFLPQRGVVRTGGRLLGAAGKGLAKALPFAGAGIGLAMGASAASKGKFADAFIHSAAGMASLIPGLGTVIAIALDVIGTLIPQTIKDSFDKFVGKALNKLWQPIQATLKNLLGPTGFGALMIIWKTFGGIFSNIGGILSDLFNIFKKLFVGPYSLPVIFGAISVAISPFVFIASEFLHALKAFTGFISDFLDLAGQKGFWDALTQSFMDNIGKWFNRVWTGLTSAFSFTINKIIPSIGDMVAKGLIGLGTSFLKGMISVGGMVLKGLIAGTPLVPQFIKQKAIAGVDKMTAAASGGVDLAAGAVKSLMPHTFGKETPGAAVPKQNAVVGTAMALEGNRGAQAKFLRGKGMSEKDIGIFQALGDRGKAQAFLAKKFPAQRPQTAVQKMGATVKGAVQTGAQAVTTTVKRVGSVVGGAVGTGVGKVKAFAGSLGKDIADAAARYGISADFLHKMARIESGGNPNAVSPTGATGIFQFTKGTGRQYGLLGPGFDNRTNQRDNVMAGAALAADNAKQLQSMGVPATPGMLYLAHQQGVGGAAAIYNAAMTGSDVPANIRRNMDLNGGKGLTPREFLAKWVGKFESGASAFAQKASDVAAGAAGKIGSGAKSTMAYLSEAGKGAMAQAGPMLGTAGQKIGQVAGAAGPAVAGFAQSVAQGLHPLMAGGVGGLVDAAGQLPAAVKAKLPPGMSRLMGQIQTVSANVENEMARELSKVSEAIGFDPMNAKIAAQGEQQTRLLQATANSLAKQSDTIERHVENEISSLLASLGWSS